MRTVFASVCGESVHHHFLNGGDIPECNPPVHRTERMSSLGRAKRSAPIRDQVAMRRSSLS